MAQKDGIVPAVAPPTIGIEHKLVGNSRFRYTHVRIVGIERIMHWRKVVVANAR